MNWDDCRTDLLDSGYYDLDDDDVDDHYNDQVESWISYRVSLFSPDENPEES